MTSITRTLPFSRLANETILQIMGHLVPPTSDGLFSLDPLKSLSAVNWHFRILSYGFLFREISLTTRPADLSAKSVDVFCRDKPHGFLTSAIRSCNLKILNNQKLSLGTRIDHPGRRAKPRVDKRVIVTNRANTYANICQALDLMTHLTELHVTPSSPHVFSFTMPPNDRSRLQLPTLKVLTITAPFNVSKIIAACPKLQTLKMPWHTGISDKVILEAAGKLKNLRCLELWRRGSAHDPAWNLSLMQYVFGTLHSSGNITRLALRGRVAIPWQQIFYPLEGSEISAHEKRVYNRQFAKLRHVRELILSDEFERKVEDPASFTLGTLSPIAQLFAWRNIDLQQSRIDDIERFSVTLPQLEQVTFLQQGVACVFKVSRRPDGQVKDVEEVKTYVDGQCYYMTTSGYHCKWHDTDFRSFRAEDFEELIFKDGERGRVPTNSALKRQVTQGLHV